MKSQKRGRAFGAITVAPTITLLLLGCSSSGGPSEPGERPPVLLSAEPVASCEPFEPENVLELDLAQSRISGGTAEDPVRRVELVGRAVCVPNVYSVQSNAVVVPDDPSAPVEVHSFVSTPLEPDGVRLEAGFELPEGDARLVAVVTWGPPVPATRRGDCIAFGSSAPWAVSNALRAE